MRRFSRHIYTIFLPVVFCFCSEAPKPERYLNAELLPAQIITPKISVQHLNYWVEKGQFFVTGICVNESAAWQKIWLKAEILNKDGQLLQIQGNKGVIFQPFSSAIAPKAGSAFFVGWPLTEIAGSPNAARVSGAAASTVQAGPILLTEEISAVKMMMPAKESEPATEETAWQISAVLNNALPATALHPRLELLLFGTDNRLWLSTLLNPEDPALKQMVAMEKEGPMQGREKRQLGIMVYYERLPEELRVKKIGRVELLGFEER
jgi:hypothetical protein